MPVPPCGRARDDDALHIDHLAHDSARTVRRGHQRRREAQLRRRDFLKAAEQHVRRRVRPRQCHAEPAEQRAEEWIEHAAACKGEAEDGVEARVPCEVPEREHRHDRQQRGPRDAQRPHVRATDRPKAATHRQPAEQGGDEDARARGGEDVEREHRGFRRGRGDHRRNALHHSVQPRYVQLRRVDVIQEGLHRHETPREHEHAEQRPRNPRGERRGTHLDRRATDGGTPTELDERGDDGNGRRAGDDIHEVRALEVRHQELRHGEAHARHQQHGPRGLDAAHAVVRRDEPERHDQREQRKLTAHHLAQRQRVDARDAL